MYGYGGYGGYAYRGFGYGGIFYPLLATTALVGTTAALASSASPNVVIVDRTPPPNPVAVIPTTNPYAIAQQYPQYDVYYVPKQ